VYWPGWVNVWEKMLDEARRGELHSPWSAVDVCDSVPSGSQFTQVTVPPTPIRTSAGAKAKFLIATTVVPGTPPPEEN
jgi:hypothetical protein